jgi:TonB family protein
VYADKSKDEEAIMNRISILCAGIALFATLLAQTGMAQPQSYAERKVVSKIAPFYPEVAKRNHIRGVVKLEVVVRTNGSVQSMKVLGGNPFLIEAAIFAVNKWKFERALEETTETVQIAFDN